MSILSNNYCRRMGKVLVSQVCFCQQWRGGTWTTGPCLWPHILCWGVPCPDPLIQAEGRRRRYPVLVSARGCPSQDQGRIPLPYPLPGQVHPLTGLRQKYPLRPDQDQDRGTPSPARTRHEQNLREMRIAKNSNVPFSSNKKSFRLAFDF